MISKTSPEPNVLPVFEPKTGTWQYIISCPTTSKACILDPVLDYDPSTATISTTSADALLSHIASKSLTVTHIMETHAHADHLTASRYLQASLTTTSPNSLTPQICIGRRIKDVQATFSAKYGIDKSDLIYSFDKLWDDGETFEVGELTGQVLYLPGHTPDHVGYAIGSNVFTGDSIFNPDVGSARCDFPGGDASALWNSMNTLLSLPEEYRLYTGHDYPPGTREAMGEVGKEKAYTTVKEQREENKHAKIGTAEEEFVSWRRERDGGLGEPRLLHQAMQVNIRGGRLPAPSPAGDRFFAVPIKAPAVLMMGST